jgi:hypothetical protein
VDGGGLDAMRRFDHGIEGRKPNGRIFRIRIVVKVVLVRIDGKDDAVNGETGDMQHPHTNSSNPKLRGALLSTA